MQKKKLNIDCFWATTVYVCKRLSHHYCSYRFFHQHHHNYSIAQHLIFPTAYKLKETSASFVSGGIFQIAAFIRPWESEAGTENGKRLNVCFLSVSSCDLPSQPSITEVEFKQQTECLSPSVSSLHFTVCLLTQITNYLLVTRCTTNKLGLEREERGQGSNKMTNREQRANRQQTLTWRNRKIQRHKKLVSIKH